MVGAHIVGLDLSMRSTGVCLLPSGWSGDTNEVVFKNIETSTVEPGDSNRINRSCNIVNYIVDFIETTRMCDFTHGMIVGTESIHIGSGYNVIMLTKLHGAVELALWQQCGLPLHTVNVSSARKTLRDGQPIDKGKGAAKKQASRIVNETFGKAVQPDCADAYVIANHIRANIDKYKELNA